MVTGPLGKVCQTLTCTAVPGNVVKHAKSRNDPDTTGVKPAENDQDQDRVMSKDTIATDLRPIDVAIGHIADRDRILRITDQTVAEGRNRLKYTVHLQRMCHPI